MLKEVSPLISAIMILSLVACGGGGGGSSNTPISIVPTSSPTSTPVGTSAPSATPTPNSTSVPTPSATPIPTQIPTSTPSPTPSPTPTPSVAATPTTAPGALTASWTGIGTFTAFGSPVSAQPATSVYGGVIAYSAVSQAATVSLSQVSGNGHFSYGLGSISSLSGGCQGNATVTQISPNIFSIMDIGTGFNGCAVYFFGSSTSGPNIYFQVTGPVILGGTVS